MYPRADRPQNDVCAFPGLKTHPDPPGLLGRQLQDGPHSEHRAIKQACRGDIEYTGFWHESYEGVEHAHCEYEQEHPVEEFIDTITAGN